MPESPDRRRRDKPTKTAKAPAPINNPTPASPSAPDTKALASVPRRFSIQANVVWALVTGLAVGFAVGREAYRFGLDGARSAADSSAAPAFIAAEGSSKKVYARSADFPAGWVKDTDLANSATLFAGLNDTQKTTVMQALNERDCTCGCTFGSLANCLHKDPGCPASPAIAKMAVDLIKQGKGLDDILAAIDAKQKGGQKPEAAPEPPSTPKYVELAAWNPRLGPKEAKVTIVEFSDFQ